MHRNHVLTAVAFSGLAMFFIAGCGSAGSEPTDANGKETSSAPSLPPDTVDLGHNHPSEGPHHGSLIELGKEEYHAELVHDEATGTVTIYILDSTAKKTVPIEARELVVNLKHGGRGEQFKLSASPDQGDPAGKSSRFISSEAELSEDLDAEGAEARLVVKIAGKSYLGNMKHDHAGHDHGHGADGHKH